MCVGAPQKPAPRIYTPLDLLLFTPLHISLLVQKKYADIFLTSLC